MNSTANRSTAFTQELFNRVQKNGKYLFVTPSGVKIRSITGAFNTWLDRDTKDVRYYPNINLAGFASEVEDFYNTHRNIIATDDGEKDDLGIYYDANIVNSQFRDNFIEEYQEASRKSKVNVNIKDLEFYVKNLTQFKPQSVATRRNAKTLASVMDSVKAFNARAGAPDKLVNVSNLLSSGEGASEFSTTNKSNRYRHYLDMTKMSAIKAVTIPDYDDVVSSTLEGVKNFLKIQGCRITEGRGKEIIAEWKKSSSGQRHRDHKAATATAAAKAAPKKGKRAARSTSPTGRKVGRPKGSKSKSPSRSPSPTAAAAAPKRGPGRPKGSKSKSKSRSPSRSPSPSAPYGVKADGTPKKQPGPKKGTKRAASKSPRAAGTKKRAASKSRSPSRSPSPTAAYGVKADGTPKKKPGPKKGTKRAASKSPRAAGTKKRATSKSPSRSPSPSAPYGVKADGTPKRKPGRPKGSKSKSRSPSRSPAKSPRSSSRSPSPAAPYGVKADGTPKKQPGPKKGTKRAASKSPRASPKATTPKAAPKRGGKKQAKVASACVELALEAPKKGTIRK